MINEAVDKCELFVGLLWKKWGTSTGKDTSGFHEEFDRAWRRYQDTAKPIIWLFSKTLNRLKSLMLVRNCGKYWHFARPTELI